MRRSLVRFVAVLGTIAAVATGCGDDEERLSQEEFVAQGNAICREGNERIEAEGEAIFGDASEDNPPSEDDVRSFVEDTVIPGVEDQVDALDELNPPENLEDDFEAALAEARRALDELKDNPAAAIEEDAEDPFAEANEMIGEVGLDVCAESE